MDRIIDIERALFCNPIAYAVDYPSLNGMILEIMDIESYTQTVECIGYAYVREHNLKWFIDIYLYVRNKSRREVFRFVIVPGHMMAEEEERKFLHYMEDSIILFNGRECSTFVEELKVAAPEVHMMKYDNLCQALLHAYYASHRSGVKELLYKMGLNILAERIPYIHEYDMLGENIFEAFGIQAKLAKKLNSGFGVSVLKTRERREEARRIYETYHSMLNDCVLLKEFQYKYLRDCYESGTLPDKRVFLEYGKIEFFYDDEDELGADDLYTDYWLYRETLSHFDKKLKAFPQYPDLNNPSRFYMLRALLNTYINDKNNLDQTMYELSKEWKKRYSFEDDSYLMKVPTKIKDLLNEADAMHNCLYDYVFPVVAEQTVILFMRQKTNPRKSYVTIEIKEGSINQARRACNAKITSAEEEFLRKYAKDKGLQFVPELV